ncbi:mycothiol system anti-sigma-R factor [Demequina sp.]|uniref:mycothiol system anti-sigma-R factor n=1 Tax=Demequina sp. TaxID=2050685 RepID=UPI0025BE1F8D|nr:mycothiol system anti-sigma-R factor [Demequina sp.]
MTKRQCQEAVDRLFEFIDGELTDEELLRIGAHLKECPPCEAELRINEKIRLLVSQAHGEKAPHQLRERVLSTLRMAREESV